MLNEKVLIVTRHPDREATSEWGEVVKHTGLKVIEVRHSNEDISYFYRATGMSTKSPDKFIVRLP